MSGFKFGTANRDTGMCARMGCYEYSRYRVTVNGVAYYVCKRHR